jgi:hypothetical protein
MNGSRPDPEEKPMPVRIDPGSYMRDETIPGGMALTDLVVDHWRSESPLEGVTALFFQHQLGNQVPMTQALIDLGLDPERITWVDIPYTSHKPVRDALLELGLDERKLIVSDDFGLLDNYGPHQRKRALDVTARLLRQDPEHLLVLDDGAYFLEAMTCFERRFRRCATVEQTSRGFKKLVKNAAMVAILDEVPLIDVARSVPKGELESPFIGQAVCSSLAHHIDGRLSCPPHEARCLVLGFGNIGSAVARFLGEAGGFSRENVFVCDPRLQTGEIESPHRTWQRNDGGGFDLLIGCSGNTSFDVGDSAFLNEGAVLASASSGAVEFNRRNVVEWAAASDLDDLRIGEVDTSNLHCDIPIHFPNRNVTLLNGGFPANFDGRVNCIPNRYIQITMALMVQAAVQAVRADRPGIHGIDRDMSLKLVEAFYVEAADAAHLLPEKSQVMRAIRDHEPEPVILS